MMDTVIVRMTREHLEYVAEHCRETDRKEIYLQSGLDPHLALDVTAEFAEGAWAGIHKGVPVAVFGVNRASILSDIGVPWLVATDGIMDCQIAFLRLGRNHMKRIFRAFPVMSNYVWEKNHAAIRWLKWLGFDIGEPETYGAGHAQFRRFTRGEPCAPALKQ